MRNFSTSLIILFVVAVIGGIYQVSNIEFFEASYQGYLVKNGHRIDNGDVKVRLSKERDRFTVVVDYQFVGEPSDEARKMLNDRLLLSCNYSEFEPIKVSQGRVAYDLVENLPSSSCARTKVVFEDMDNAKLQLNSGAVIKIQRIPVRDMFISDKQKELYKKLVATR